MATKTCSVNTGPIDLDVTNGERLILKVTNNAAGAAFAIREQMAGEPEGRTVLHFNESPGPVYETLWPWPGEKPASGRHGFVFVAAFFLSTTYRLQVFELDAGGKRTLVKDCVYEREDNNDLDRKFDRFVVKVS